MKLSSLLVLGVGLAGLAPGAIVFNRGLPDSVGANNPIPALRSNVTWQSSFAFIWLWWTVGDDFSVATNGTVDSITVYEVSNNVIGGGLSTLPTDEFASLTLYYVGQFGNVNPVLDNNTSTYTYAQTSYQPGATNYLGSSGVNQFAIYAITFSGLNFSVLGGTTYGFALDGTPSGQNGGANTVALHASNAALSGTPQQGADNQFRYFTQTAQGVGNGSFIGFCDSGSASCGGWDKSSDINVVINGTLQVGVPEPATLGTLAAGLAGLILFARKRRK